MVLYGETGLVTRTIIYLYKNGSRGKYTNYRDCLEKTDAYYGDLDENHDGGLSASEFNDARANRAVEKSQQGLPIGSLRNAPTFEAIDLNGDGRISAEEFAVVQTQHSQPQPQR